MQKSRLLDFKWKDKNLQKTFNFRDLLGGGKKIRITILRNPSQAGFSQNFLPSS